VDEFQENAQYIIMSAYLDAYLMHLTMLCNASLSDMHQRATKARSHDVTYLN